MAKNKMKSKKGGGGEGTEEESYDQPQASQESQQPATYGTDSRYSIGNIMSRVGAAQAGQPMNAAPATPQFDRSAMVQRVMAGPATEGPASAMQQPDQNDALRTILARISQRNAGY